MIIGTMINMATAMGVGVMLSAIPMLIYQGGLTLPAAWFGKSLSETMIDEITAIGGILLIGIGFTMLNIKKIDMLNLLPALIIIIPLVYFFG
ncbi:MAG TPA: DUF554 family protein [Tenuifilaceae bacterium]|nr:DUF554 family protein [Tenuifilaceae bacterium]